MTLLSLVWHSPITPPDGLTFIGSVPPILAIFGLLTASVGLPFFLLASNSTLVQVWFNRLFPTKTAYRLYALSNASSLVALIIYPFVIEPNLTLPRQGWVWSLAYLLFAGVTLFWTIRILRLPEPVVAAGIKETSKPAAKEYGLWIALSACTSILLLAITN
jgi:hypothetical protein